MSRDIPYHPMGQKTSTTTPEQMFAKLEARNVEIRKKAGQSAQPKAFAQMDREMLLATRLKQHGIRDMFDGLTTTEQRRDNMRKAILENALSEVFAGKRGEQPIQFAGLFELTYWEPQKCGSQKLSFVKSRAAAARAGPGGGAAAPGRS